jgi:hypothetical protein
MILQLCKLLENDLDDVTSPTRIKESPSTEVSKSQFHKNLTGKKMVSYEDFLAQYWSHFPRSLTKNLGNPHMSLLLSPSA